MASKRNSLGKGLGALLGNLKPDFSKEITDTVNKISVEKIKPNRYQPRREFDEESLNELAESIKSYGILQPIIVRKLDDDYFELVAGERRLRASKIAGLEKIPAIVREYTDAQTSEISIIENVRREDLNPIEEAAAYERLMNEFGYTQETLSAKIGCSRPHIANSLRLLKLAPKVRDYLTSGQLSAGHVRPLLAIENPELQTKAADIIFLEDLSVRKVEVFVSELKKSGLSLKRKEENISEKDGQKDIPAAKESKKKSEKSGKKIPEIRDVEKPEKISETGEKNGHVSEAENKLTEILGAPVEIVAEKDINQIRINYSDDEELSRIVAYIDRTIPNSGGVPVSTKEEKIAALRKFSTTGAF